MNSSAQLSELVAAWTVLAHANSATVAGPSGWGELLRAWTLDPLVVFALLSSAALYRRGARRWRGKISRHAGLRRWEVGCFWAGWFSLALALVSPLHAWGQVLFSAHMTQHELLMLVAAPLLVLGRPIAVFLFALPRPDARQVSRVARVPLVRATWRFLTFPLVAWAVHAVALWTWHVPAFFQATITSEWIHHAQHVSFFGSALLFWWALIHAGSGIIGYGAAVLYLFTTMVHSGLLGALLTFAQAVLYPAYQYGAAAWSLTPLEDQQLGGLIMWAPAGLVYIVGPRRLAAAAARRRMPGGAAMLLAMLLMGGCAGRSDEEATALTGGSPRAGRATIQQIGCGACHTIPGIAGANALVGPPLDGVANRSYIGGVLPNTPDNLVRWLLDPPAQSPRTIMPNTNLSEAQARDVAAYLYTLD